jgi:hypothetical protein
MSSPYNYDDETSHLYSPKFGVFNGKSSGSVELDECGPYWGHKVPERLVTWLNKKGDDSSKKPERQTEREDVQGSSDGVHDGKSCVCGVVPTHEY